MESNIVSHNVVGYSQKHKVGPKRIANRYVPYDTIYTALNKCKTTLYVVNYIQKVSGKAEWRLGPSSPSAKGIYNINIVRYRDI